MLHKIYKKHLNTFDINVNAIQNSIIDVNELESFQNNIT